MKSLQKGDTVAIVAPAKQIDEKSITFAKSLFEANGFKVKLGKNLLLTNGYFAGTDQQRADDLQFAIDDPKVKAIVCARGGYGCIRIVDLVNWANLLHSKKWLIGFSDVTVFHQHINKYGLKTIHGTMPLNFESNSLLSLETLFSALKGKKYSITTSPNQHNIEGKATGELIGGNLSILYSLLGTRLQPDYEGKILFIEEVGEQLYAIDRMFYSLEKAGILNKIKGLIIGGMTAIEDTEPPTGLTIYDIIQQKTQYSCYPICYDFPAGHIDDNRAVILGGEASLIVSDEEVTLTFDQNDIYTQSK